METLQVYTKTSVSLDTFRFLVLSVHWYVPRCLSPKGPKDRSGLGPPDSYGRNKDSESQGQESRLRIVDTLERVLELEGHGDTIR